MKPVTLPLTTAGRGGFSLIELLVVISLIALLAGLGVSAFRGGAASTGTEAASSLAYSLFNQARTEAIMRQTKCRLVIDTAYNPSVPENYLRRVAVAMLEDGVWKQTSKWTVLPGQNYFNAEFSSPHGQDMTLEFAGQGAPKDGYAYYEFTPLGQVDTAAQFVISPGRIENGSFIEKGETSRYGFFLHRMGRLSFFQDNTEIQKPASS